jgi:hypothetical protein
MADDTTVAEGVRKRTHAELGKQEDFITTFSHGELTRVPQKPH